MRRMLENPALLPYFEIEIKPTQEDEEAGEVFLDIKQDGFYNITVHNNYNLNPISFTANFNMPVIVDGINIGMYIKRINSWGPTVDNNMGWGSAPAYNLRDGYAGSDKPYLSVYDIPAKKALNLLFYVANGVVRGYLPEV